MTRKFSLAFSHVGLYVTDIDKMVDFYTRFLGFVVSDRGKRETGEIVFMTRDAREHHQLVHHRDAGVPTLHLDAIHEPQVDDVHADLGVDDVAQRLADISLGHHVHLSSLAIFPTC